MRLIDTHCHVDLYRDFAGLIEETESAQVYTVAVTNAPSVFRRCVSLTEGRRFIRTALGLHPQLVGRRHRELDLMLGLLPETKYVGEVGLDFETRDPEERALQRKVFAGILERCADSPDKVLTVHSRRAAAEVIDLIGDSYPCKVILHWFSGSLRELEKAVSHGFYFSVNPAMISSAKGRQIVSAVPRDKLLTESDGPFVTVDGRPARPRDVEVVVRGLADLYASTASQVAGTLYDNFRSILT
jgi:TatD DNase family protein